ncbi:trans-sulfuration enzyme family protein [Alterisphingorhabdus coralli]|uniref:PLP-dependent aspartate aminotransferase family protein n=1 Tax=Alterisphingorhabdus coralli TaxID=3071408 RepID=A0AA97FB09_9SPHN|nr:PLP-dependent aspartate aminotransferase family protein [Parasphingorhabdus sp. SCSIO 66989]WOE76552.1 PLP-dependent aspartate aminotransferase family protein [Parasphingorhabdus sp. SCSIO 66989]
MADDPKALKPETAAIHVPHVRRDGAMAPPIHMATTFEHGPAYETLHGFDYSRSSNPNVADLEARLTALERGSFGLAYASGMAAGAALLDTLPVGARVVFHNSLYHGFRALAGLLESKGRIVPVFIDLNDGEALEKELAQKPALVWLESPTNPTLEILDIAAIADKAHAVGAKLAVDGTFATPALQQPISLGADYVIHSLTKYIGGHSDVMGGALIAANDALQEELSLGRSLSGAVLSPFNAWLAARGLQTLHCRVATHCAHAHAVAKALEGHPRLSNVHYPGLADHPGHSIAASQMHDFGGMVSIELADGRDAAIAMASKVRLFTNATSLGGVESLIEHRASVEEPHVTSPLGLLRLSVGLENPADLVADLLQALEG